MSPVDRGTSGTARRVPDTAYDAWLTKAQVAVRIGRSEKAVQRLAATGQIQQASCQREGRGPFRTVYHPDDVARIAQERQPEAVAFVLPAGVNPHLNGHGHGSESLARSPATSLATTSATSAGEVASILCSLVAALQEASRTSRTAEPRYVTVKDAAVILGLPQADVRRLIHDGDLNHRLTGRGGVRIRRKDLEAL